MKYKKKIYWLTIAFYLLFFNLSFAQIIIPGGGPPGPAGSNANVATWSFFPMTQNVDGAGFIFSNAIYKGNGILLTNLFCASTNDPTQDVAIATIKVSTNALNSFYISLYSYTTNVAALLQTLTVSNYYMNVELTNATASIALLNAATNAQNSTLTNLDTTVTNHITNDITRDGGIMIGPMTNMAGYYGNGVGLTNIPGAGTMNHPTLTNQNGDTNFLHFSATEKAIATNTLISGMSNDAEFVTAAITNGFTQLALYRYDAYAAEPNTVWVFATATNITAVRASSTYTFTIPAGTRLISSKIRVDAGNTDSGKIYLALGTTDMDQSGTTDDWIPLANASREDTLANVPVTSIIHGGDTTKIVISGLGTIGGIWYHVGLRF